MRIKGWAEIQGFPLHLQGGCLSREDSGIALKGQDSFREDMKTPAIQFWFISQRNNLVQNRISKGKLKTRIP